MFVDRNASSAKLSRRNFLINSAVAGGGLVLSLSLSLGENKAAGAEAFVPNAFIRIGGDGQVVLTMPYVEMGQGTYTSIPMLIAEELEVDLKIQRCLDYLVEQANVKVVPRKAPVAGEAGGHDHGIADVGHSHGHSHSHDGVACDGDHGGHSH